MAVLLKKILPTIILVFLGVWVVRYGYLWEKVDNREYAYNVSEMQNLASFDQAWVDYGLKAWYEGRPSEAGDYYQNAIVANVLNVDAWLHLAQKESSDGNRKKALDILRFIDNLTRRSVKWKWQILLMAFELNDREIFIRNINQAAGYPQLERDTFGLLDRYVKGKSDVARQWLTVDNLPRYLKWLMRYARVADTRLVWEVLNDTQKKAENLHEHYAAFLLSHQEVQSAVDIWRKTGGPEMINSGFEQPFSTSNPFDWRPTITPFWEIKRDLTNAREGNASLLVTFLGKENIHFAHVRKILPVKPGVDYELRFWWRSRSLTTDQLPYMTIRGLHCDSVVYKSDMIPGDCNWRQEKIRFTAPDDCHAVVLLLYRQPSNRFDSHISGQLWLDDFQIEPSETF